MPIAGRLPDRCKGSARFQWGQEVTLNPIPAPLRQFAGLCLKAESRVDGSTLAPPALVHRYVTRMLHSVFGMHV